MRFFLVIRKIIIRIDLKPKNLEKATSMAIYWLKKYKKICGTRKIIVRIDLKPKNSK